MPIFRTCNFLRDTRGSVTVTAAFSLIPLVVLAVGTVQITRSMAMQTRMHQSQITSVLAVAKEGETAPADARNALAAAYMQQNVKVLKNDLPPQLMLVNEGDREGLEATLQTKPLAEKLLGKMFDAPLTDSVRSERFYRPIEVVVLMDSSVSMRSQRNMLREAAAQVSETVFRGKESADDVRISLVAYSDWVNVGREYADKIVKPESRALYMAPFIPYNGPDPGPQPTFDPDIDGPAKSTNPKYLAYRMALNKWTSAYNASVKDKIPYEAGIARKNTLETYYSGGLVSDLLAPGGPGDGEHDVMCLARRPLPQGSSSGAIEKYAENIDKAPSDPGEGFDAIFADDRSITEWKTKKITPGEFFSYAYYGFSDTNFLDLAKVPEPALNGRSDVRMTTNAATYDGKNGTGISGSATSTVSIPLGCPPMPMLVGAQTMQEVLDRIELFGGSWSTGGDEAIAWATRLLSPEWSDIWDKGGNFPAPYHSATEKRILYLAGSLTEGYVNFNGSPNAHIALCKQLEEKGIDLFIVVNAEGTINAQSKTTYKACTSPERLYEAKKSALVPEVLAQMAQRHYRVRVAE